MSETARIREAARQLARQRPDDTRPLGRVETAAQPSAIDVAAKYRELVQRASADVLRRMRGLEGLFGEDVARPLADASEELRELFYATLDMHELAHHQRDQYMMRLRSEHAGQTARNVEQIARRSELLREAMASEDRRLSKCRADRRTPAPWYDAAIELLSDEAPF